MILLTGASGTVGRALLPILLEEGQDIRALVRDPRGLGRHRVDVQIALGDLARLGDRHLQRQALRGVDTVIHLAAAIRDEPHTRVEELNGLATARLLRAAERAGVERFVFFSALGASDVQRTRFFRAKALAERAVAASPLATIVVAPSIVYDPGDRWVRLMRRFALLPVIPISGSGRAAYQPIWAGDVARCVVAALGRDEASARYELAGPETLTYDEIVLTVARAAGRRRPLVHVPLGLVHLSLVALRRTFGEAAFATWEEAELMEVPMVTPRGPADAESLGIEPRRLEAVLRSQA
ncbi:MAG TPA: NAD(P)H-binding protein [Solirubrobacterales bacterium]|nr:NAD(P)H-binding protein [Solirubrobacterales bacterium]